MPEVCTLQAVNCTSSSDRLQIQARSDDQSNHVLDLLALTSSDGNLVLITNTSGELLGPMQANELVWLPLAAANNTLCLR